MDTSTHPSRLDALVYKVQKKILLAWIITFSKYQQESRQLFISLQLFNIYELNSYQTDYFSLNNTIQLCSETLHQVFWKISYEIHIEKIMEDSP